MTTIMSRLRCGRSNDSSERSWLVRRPMVAAPARTLRRETWADFDRIFADRPEGRELRLRAHVEDDLIGLADRGLEHLPGGEDLVVWLWQRVGALRRFRHIGRPALTGVDPLVA